MAVSYQEKVSKQKDERPSDSSVLSPWPGRRPTYAKALCPRWETLPSVLLILLLHLWEDFKVQAFPLPHSETQREGTQAAHIPRRTPSECGRMG